MTALAEDVRLFPDAYQRERAARLGVSEKGIGHALRRMGVTYKKSPSSPKPPQAHNQTFKRSVSAENPAGQNQ